MECVCFKAIHKLKSVGEENQGKEQKLALYFLFYA